MERKEDLLGHWVERKEDLLVGLWGHWVEQKEDLLGHWVEQKEDPWEHWVDLKGPKLDQNQQVLVLIQEYYWQKRPALGLLKQHLL